MSEVLREPTEGEIRLRAYRIWQWLGAPDGYENEIWVRAERELRAEIAKERVEQAAGRNGVRPAA